VVAPLSELLKDEVRRPRGGDDGEAAENIMWRHPLPGPGLAGRIIGDAAGALSVLRRTRRDRLIEAWSRQTCTGRRRRLFAW